MAGTNQLTLELLIKAVADAKGIVVTKQEIDKLAESMRSAAGASGTLDTSVGSITDALQRQKTVTESAGTEWDKLTDAQKGAHREAAQVALRQIEVAEAAKKASRESGNLVRNINSVKGAFGGLKDIVSGALSGNLLQIGQGFGRISAAAAGATPAVRALFAQVARGAAAGSAIAAPIIVGIAALKQKAEETQKEIDRIYKEKAASEENTTKLIEEHAARRAAAHEKDMKAIQALADAYEDSRKRTDKAYARDEKLDPARKALRDEQLNTAEKKELARAKTDAERKKIKDKYDLKRSANEGQDTVDAFDRADARADIEKTKAEEAMREANEKLRAKDLEVAEAKQRFERAMDTTRVFKPTDNSAAAQAARDTARAAKENYDKVKADRDEAAGATTAIVETAQEVIDAANLDKEETALRRAHYQATIDGKLAEASAPTPADATKKEEVAVKETGDKAADLEARIEAEKDRAFRSTKHGDTPNIAGLVKELEATRRAEAAAHKARDEVIKAMSDDAKKRKADAELRARQAKNTAGGTNG